MSLVYKIAGVDQTIHVIAAALTKNMPFRYHRVAGSPATISFATYDLNGASGYRPAIDESFELLDGAASLVKGVIADLDEAAMSDAESGFDIGVLTNVTANDNNALILRDSYTKTYAAGTTVKQILQDLITNVLGARGVTLDPSQPDGPPLSSDMVFQDAFIDDILNKVQTETGHIWDLTTGLVLSQIAAGSVASGLTLSDNAGEVLGGVTFRQSRNTEYANRIILVYGQPQQVVITDTFTGDGVTNSWPLTYTPVPSGSFILSRGLVNEGGADLTLDAYPGTASYSYRASDNKIYRNAGAAGVGVAISFTYTVQFPQQVTVSDAGEIAAHGIYTRRYTAPDVFAKAAATDLATSLLSRTIALPKMVSVRHRSGFVKLGQTVVLDFAARSLSGAFMVIETGFYVDVDQALTYELTLVEGSQLVSSWLDYFKKGGSAAGSAGSTVISGTFIPQQTGTFEGDVVANAGKASGGEYETSLRASYVNSSTQGPAAVLGRSDKSYTWRIVADTLFGASGGRSRLKWIPSTVTSYAMALMERALGASGAAFYLLPGRGGIPLFLGDYDGQSGETPPDNRIEAILANNIMALSGVYERSRTVRMGEEVDVTSSYTLSDFTATTGNWTVDRADILNLSYAIIGKKLTISFTITATDVSAGTAELLMKIPGGFTSARRVDSMALAVDAGGNAEAIQQYVTAGGNQIHFARLSGAGNWSATTGDNTNVVGQIEIEIQ